MRSVNFVNFFILVFLFVISSASNAIKDPYSILGVSKHATTQEIRHAYKRLAKEWHPDKSLHPDAEMKFIQIKQAYELLNDSERRRIYDQFGITNEDSHYFKQRHDYSNYNRFSTDPLEDLFGKKFFFDHDLSLFHKLSISSKYFEQNVIPKSFNTPHIIMFYNDWCFHCSRVVGPFKKLREFLEPLGIIFATVNAAHEPQLIRKTGVSNVPSLVVLLNGHCFIYRENVFTSSKVVEFIRRKLPYKLYENVDDSNFVEFLSGWSDNRVRALILEPRSTPRLRYVIAAFHFHKNIAFGFVHLTQGNSQRLQEIYKINPNLDTLLIFNENTHNPIATVAMADIPQKTLFNVLASNQYLTLPRLSSQEMLEGVCPAEWNRPRKRLCVVLITENNEAHDFARTTLRDVALQSSFSTDRVRYAYIFKEVQQEFMRSLSEGSLADNLLRLVVLWRRDASHVKYEWISDAIIDVKPTTSHAAKEQLVNVTRTKIDNALQRLLKASESLTYEASVENLLDEHAQTFLAVWWTKLLYILDYLADNVQREHILAFLSLVGTIIFMFSVGYIMIYFVRAEEENLKAKGKLSSNGEMTNMQTRNVPELKLHELRAETYNGMVRLLKPGCRTIILITDLQTRPKLIPPFHKAVWPYRRSKTLIFGHMLIEKGLSWYSELLRLSLSDVKNLNINPRNCVGTVIALNGHKKYFCMYHAKHPESTRGAKRMMKITRQLVSNVKDPEAGTFFELNESDDSEAEIDSKILLEGNLLDGLSNWLDRLFEGSTHRYFVNYWPEFPTK